MRKAFLFNVFLFLLTYNVPMPPPPAYGVRLLGSGDLFSGLMRQSPCVNTNKMVALI